MDSKRQLILLSNEWAVQLATFSTIYSLATVLMILFITITWSQSPTPMFPPWWEPVVALGVWIFWWKIALKEKNAQALTSLSFLVSLYICLSFGSRANFMGALFFLVLPIIPSVLSLVFIRFVFQVPVLSHLKETGNLWKSAALVGALLGTLPIYLGFGIFTFFASIFSGHGGFD